MKGKVLEQKNADALIGMTLRDVRVFLSCFSDDAVFDYVECHGYSDFDLVIDEYREETDEEYANRLAYEEEQERAKLRRLQAKHEKEEKMRSKKEAEEKALLKKLKDKYGDTP